MTLAQQSRVASTMRSRVARRIVRLAVCTLFLIGAAPNWASAQDRPGPASLSGLRGVFLEVRADRGLEKITRARVENLLADAGIPMLSEQEWQSNYDVALLRLDVNIRCERDQFSCGYWVGVRVGQHVQLLRGQRSARTATTWQNSYTASVSRAELPILPHLIAVDVGTLVRLFVGDFGMANSR
jgi:hypothetical protein